MSLAFNRSMRALTGDRHGPSLVSLIGAGALLIAWIGWFALARVPVYSQSQEAHLALGGEVLASFDPATLARISPGQPATLIMRDSDGSTRTIPAVVSEVPGFGRYGPDRDLVRLYPLRGQELTAQPQAVRVQIEAVAPLTLVVRGFEQRSGQAGGGAP
jgi:hypothetical protein